MAIRKKRKAFFLALDSILAVMVAFALIASSLMITSQIYASATETAALKKEAEDVLTVLEKTNLLAITAVSPGSAQVIGVLSSTRDGTCMQVNLIRARDNALVRSITEPGCTRTGNYILARRSFVANREFYTAQAVAWRKMP